MRFLRLPFLLLTLPLAAAAQTIPPECPTIRLEGGGIGPTEGTRFSYSLEGLENYLGSVKVLWTLSTSLFEPSSVEIEGQGTPNASFLLPGTYRSGSITMTAKVTGLPRHCGNSASESVAWDGPPDAVKIGEMSNTSPPDLDLILRFGDELRNNPSNQGYVHLAFKPITPPDQIAKREREILDAFTRDRIGHDMRITLVRMTSSRDVTEFWRVPPGADNPSCRSCEPIERLECGLPSDEYGRIPKNDELGRLDMTAANLIKDSSWIGVVILFVAPDESKRKAEARKTLIRDHLVKTRKVPDERLDIYFARGQETRTSIYLMAPELRMTPKSAFDAEPSFDRLPRRN